MRHKITVVICLLAVIVTGFLAGRSYHNYQVWRRAQDAKAVAASQAEAHKSALQQAVFNAEVKKLQDQCAKDQAAYSVLTPAQKAKTVAPDCTLNLVQ